MTRQELTPQQSNLNLAIVGLVALVVIVAFVAIVINSGPTTLKAIKAPLVEQAAPVNAAGSASARLRAPPVERMPPEACVPQCDGRICGTDGCGGGCGICTEGVCSENGQCTSGPCTCEGAGKSCGWNYLCGQTLHCGLCGSGDTCNAGACIDGPSDWAHPGWE